MRLDIREALQRLRTRLPGARSTPSGTAAGGPARTGGASTTGGATATGGAGEETQAGEGREPWRCECGQGYTVAGRDRHRIYWPDGAADADAVLDGRCVSCGRPLPAESAARVD